MPRPAPPRIRFLAGLLLACAPIPACGAGEPPVPEPPRPADLAELDGAVARRIEEVLARLQREPHEARIWGELGFVYLAERLKSLALECFRVAGRIDPRQPRWPYHEAILLGRDGALDQAIPAMERAVALEPSYAPSHSRLAEFRLQLGDLDGAERDFAAATRIDSSYPGGWIGLARVALQRDQADRAVEILERLRKDDPEDKTFEQLLVLARREASGTPGGSLASLMVEDQVPVWNDPWALEARAVRSNSSMVGISRLLKEGKAEEALALLEEKKARGEEPVATALAMADARLLLGQTDAALREVDRALEHEPDSTAALLQKAGIVGGQGDLKQAVLLLDRVTTLQPNYADVFAAKGRELARLRMHEPALEAYARAVELGAGDWDVRFAMGNSLIALKRYPEAGEVFARLVEERPDQGNAWAELAVARLRTGKLDEAESALERARGTKNATPELLENVTSSLEQVRARRATRKEGGEPR